MTTTPVFVVGTGRCGTKTLAHLFKQLTGVHSVHEPEPALVRVASFRMGGNEYNVQRTLAHARKESVDQNTHYFESSLWNTWLISDYLELWPQAKFVWLSRFPLSWARSAYRRGWYHPDSEEHVGAYSYLRPYPASGFPQDVDRWFKLGYMWQRYTKHIVSTLSRSGAPWIQLDVGDLNKLEVVNSLVSWCGFPGEIVDLTRENTASERITLEEIRVRGLTEELQQTGFSIGAHSHPYSWVDLELVRKKTGKDIQYECIYPFTKELVESFQQGVCYE